jgi:3-oxoacyl-(acyl-carrier-protein) synthase
VTGLGVIASNGIGLNAFREALQTGKSGIRWQESHKRHNMASQIAGIPELTEDEILEVLPANFLHKFTEAMVYAALCSVECARHSGEKVDLFSDVETPVDWNTGAIIGCGLGGGMEIVLEEFAPVLRESVHAEQGRGALPLGSDAVAKVMASGVSAIVGKILGLGAQVTSNSSACTTGTEAIFEGYKNILLGYADSMYVGGTEGTHVGIYAGFDAMRDVLCSDYNDLPEKASQPMGAGACGFVPAGGCGILRLEALEFALKRGAPILCELVSAYCNSGGQRDGGSMTFPNPEGVQRCIRYVLEDAEVKPKEISLINGHLTSTTADPLEVNNWLRALKLDASEFPLIQSTKSMIGHGLGSAGAIESVAAVDQISRGYVHPSTNCEDIHPKIELISKSIPHNFQKRDLEYVIKSSFGFGDVNGCLLFKKWNGTETEIHQRS